MNNTLDAVFSFFYRMRLTIAYLVLMALVVVAITMAHQVSQRQSLIECHANNETRVVLDQVLLALVEHRDDDEPGDYQRRVELYEQLEPLIEFRDCEEEVG